MIVLLNVFLAIYLRINNHIKDTIMNFLLIKHEPHFQGMGAVSFSSHAIFYYSLHLLRLIALLHKAQKKHHKLNNLKLWCLILFMFPEN